jgi:putative glutamine amidotransferase
MEKIVIGITDSGYNFDSYETWLTEANPEIQVIKISHNYDNIDDLDQCEAVLLSGGLDVHPKFYGHEEYLEREVFKIMHDETRDIFEMSVIEAVMKHKKPILAICRGMQLMNVYFGGSLVPDIMTYFRLDHTKMDEQNDRAHIISINKDTILQKLEPSLIAFVNSAHHQAIEEVAVDFKVNARSHDKIIEGIQWSNHKRKPFFLGVQWHPERMIDFNNSMALGIKKLFIEEIKANKLSLIK